MIGEQLEPFTEHFQLRRRQNFDTQIGVFFFVEVAGKFLLLETKAIVKF